MEHKMNLLGINKTIVSVCEELDRQLDVVTPWANLEETHLLYEMVVCISGSQMLYEMSIGIADHLNAQQILDKSQGNSPNGDLQQWLIAELSKDILLKFGDGTQRRAKPRFKNRLAKLIADSCKSIYGSGQTIRSILQHHATPSGARQELIQMISGFGPKQASLFLRRIGFSSELAVLDVHILDYLELAHGTNIKRSSIGGLPHYELLEGMYRESVSHFGYGLGCIDLATWVTMRVAKQEAYI
jgi:N-glycosylase/DNA lyase